MTDDERPRDAASLARFMAAMEAYKDKAVYNVVGDAIPPEEGDGEECKAVFVAWLPGDRVRLRGGDDDEWGFVTAIFVRVSGCLYQVSWPQAKTITDHWGFELEDAG